MVQAGIEPRSTIFGAYAFTVGPNEAVKSLQRLDLAKRGSRPACNALEGNA